MGMLTPVSLHSDLIHTEATGEQRVVGRVEIQDDLVVVSNQVMDQLDELILVPRFDPDSGETISSTDQPHAYLRQVADDLSGATGLRTTPLHGDGDCDSASAR
jgi:hypothetical protein